MSDTTGKNTRLLLLGALPQEIAAFKHLSESGGYDQEIHVETVGVSKPIAAATTQRLIHKYDPAAIIFTGVAGSLDEKLDIGDICICSAAIDADLDVRPWDSTYRRGEVPFTRQRTYTSDQSLVELAKSAPHGPGTRASDGYVACGSRFLDAKGKEEFRRDCLRDLEAELEGINRIPNLYDMESSAVLQVANTNNVPCLVIRAISDNLRGDSPADFNSFVERSVDCYVTIVEHILHEI